jgi:hypothetical protein
VGADNRLGWLIIVPTGDRLLPPGMTPALTWDGVPHGTAGLVLLVDDPAGAEGSAAQCSAGG